MNTQCPVGASRHPRQAPAPARGAQVHHGRCLAGASTAAGSTPAHTATCTTPSHHHHRRRRRPAVPSPPPPPSPPRTLSTAAVAPHLHRCRRPLSAVPAPVVSCDAPRRAGHTPRHWEFGTLFYPPVRVPFVIMNDHLVHVYCLLVHTRGRAHPVQGAAVLHAPPFRGGLTQGQCSIFTGMSPEAKSNAVTLRIKYGIIPKKSGIYVPIRLRNQIWDKYHFSGTQLWHERRAEGREFIMPPRRTGFNEYMPQGQRTHDLEHERLLRAGWAVHAGVGLFNQKGNTFMSRCTATSPQGASLTGWGASSLGPGG